VDRHSAAAHASIATAAHHAGAAHVMRPLTSTCIGCMASHLDSEQ